MTPTFFAIALIVVGILHWRRRRPRLAFRIDFTDGTATVDRGKVARRFLTEVREILGDTGLPAATVDGWWQKGELTLRFSDEVPERTRQRIRNVWFIAGR